MIAGAFLSTTPDTFSATFSQGGYIERDFDDFNGLLPHFQKAPAT